MRTCLVILKSMPITPFHFGPALAAKAAAPKYVSFLAFGVTQIVIDAEVVFYLWNEMRPLHRFHHTYLGATVIAVLTVILGRPLLRAAIHGWNRLIASYLRSGLRIEPRVPVLPTVTGALLGGWSHVLLDSMLYADMRPFAPWSAGNTLLDVLAGFEVYLLCVALGVFGTITWLGAFVRRRILVARKP